MAEIVCIGYACADVAIRGTDLGTPFTEEFKFYDNMMLGVGGDAANEAIVMAHLGKDVKLITGLGDDSVGDFIESVFSSANIDTSAIHRTESSVSSMTLVVVQKDGQRNFVIPKEYPKSSLFEPQLDAAKGASIVSLGSIFSPPLTTAGRVHRIVRELKSDKTLICADVVYTPTDPECSLEKIKDSLKYIDFIFPNEEEARGLTGKDTLDQMADQFLAYGVKNVLIKIGKDGCFFKNKTDRFFSPCIGPKGIDTTGAGDNFAAGFITALSEGKSLKECCIFAAAVAGVGCQAIGSNAGVKSRAQVEEFLEKYYLKEN